MKRRVNNPVAKRLLRRKRRSQRRGVAIVMVLGALVVLTVMLTEFQDETAADFGAALSERDAIKAEYAAKSAVNLTRLLIAAEPTIRKALAPLFLMMRSGPPQIPVWEFADQALGAFNDDSGKEAFTAIAGVNLAEGKNLGLEDAGFTIQVVDEDSKINLNLAARGDTFSQIRVGGQVLGLISHPQYDPMFEHRDADGQFSDRQAICSAIVDWTDPDQDSFTCDISAGAAQQSAAEDSHYERLKKPYSRKNSAFDSLEELRLVRGIGDDFWSTFVDPDPDNLRKRVITVWGQGQINVNSANPQTILAFLCAPNIAPQNTICVNPVDSAKFLGALTMVQGFTMGAPVFSSPRGFVNALQGKGMFGSVLKLLEIPPVKLLSPDETMKAITTESKVFSIYATGYVRAGKRETRVRIHSVVDFRGAPPPPEAQALMNLLGTGGSAGAAGAGGTSGASGASGASGGAGTGGATLPEGAGPDAIANAFQPSPAGNVVYYRVE
jgi:general secretion pathway protein K